MEVLYNYWNEASIYYSTKFQQSSAAMDSSQNNNGENKTIRYQHQMNTIIDTDYKKKKMIISNKSKI